MTPLPLNPLPLPEHHIGTVKQTSEYPDSNNARAAAAAHFARLLDRVAVRPLNYFAECYGLSYGAVLDLVQARVLPSRAMVILLHAIDADSAWMREVAKGAKDDLAMLDVIRGKGGPSVIK